MTYENMGDTSLDYLPCRYGSSRLLFRGPKRDLSAPYMAFLGGTETYGKFVGSPFAARIENTLGVTCVNFGCPNAGVDVFLNDPFIPDAARRALVTVIQISGAQNLSNRMYSVHPRRNDRFVAPSKMLQTLYRDVDFAEFNFNKHLLNHLHDQCPNRFEMVLHDLQEAWTARMKTLLERLPGKKVLLWVAGHSPDAPENVWRDNDPLFVTREMLNDVSEHALHTVEVIPSDAAKEAGTEGMVFAEMEFAAACEVMNGAAHQETADALAPVLKGLL